MSGYTADSGQLGPRTVNPEALLILRHFHAEYKILILPEKSALHDKSTTQQSLTSHLQKSANTGKKIRHWERKTSTIHAKQTFWHFSHLLLNIGASTTKAASSRSCGAGYKRKREKNKLTVTKNVWKIQQWSGEWQKRRD